MTVTKARELELTDPFARLMNSVFTGRPLGGLEAYHRDGDWMPAADVESDAAGYTFRFDVPGVAKDDIDIRLEDGVLSVSGKRESDSETTDGTLHRRERVYGSFTRSFKLPRDADSDNVTAKYDNGVLVLTVAKHPSAQPRRIEIVS